MSFDDFVEASDYAVIEDAFKRATRIISPDLATTYSEHLASKIDDDKDSEDALIEAHTYRVLDLTEPSVRDAVQSAESARALFSSDAAQEYDDLGGVA